MYIRIEFKDIESDKTIETQELFFGDPNGMFLTSSKAQMVSPKEIREIVGCSVVFWYLDIDILNKLSYLIGETADVTNAVNLNDGLTYSIDDVNIFIDKDGSVEEVLELDVMNKLSSKLSRLLNKIQRLENGN